MGSMYEAFIGLTRFLINLHTLNETDLENIHRKYFDESSFQIKIPSSVQIKNPFWSKKSLRLPNRSQLQLSALTFIKRVIYLKKQLTSKGPQNEAAAATRARVAVA